MKFKQGLGQTAESVSCQDTDSGGGTRNPCHKQPFNIEVNVLVFETRKDGAVPSEASKYNTDYEK